MASASSARGSRNAAGRGNLGVSNQSALSKLRRSIQGIRSKVGPWPRKQISIRRIGRDRRWVGALHRDAEHHDVDVWDEGDQAVAELDARGAAQGSHRPLALRERYPNVARDAQHLVGALANGELKTTLAPTVYAAARPKAEPGVLDNTNIVSAAALGAAVHPQDVAERLRRPFFGSFNGTSVQLR